MSAPPNEGPPKAGPFETGLRTVYEGLGHIGGIILAIMTASVFLQVIMRFLGRSPFDGIDELPRYLFVWLVMIGSAAAMYRGQHTVLDYFVMRMARARALDRCVNVTGITFFLYLVN